MTLLWLILSLLAALGFYLATVHQALWPPAHAHVRTVRVAAWLCVTLAVWVAIAALGVWAGVFAALTAIMLAAVCLPYLDAWRRLRRSAR